MTINEKLATIQTKFKSKKSRFNSFGKYYFRSAEDILEATKPFIKDLGLRDKVAIVAGASRGIGKATALALATEGCHLALAARGEEGLREAATEAESAGVQILAVPCDLI